MNKSQIVGLSELKRSMYLGALDLALENCKAAAGMVPLPPVMLTLSP